MKRLLLTGAALLALAGEARAQRKDFGVGLVVGEPTGLTLEVVFGPTVSLDFALGLSAFHDEHFYLRSDLLFRLVDLAGGGSISVPLYLGVGVFLFDHEHRDDDLHLGPRVPFGIALDFRRVPIEFFFEVALRVILVSDNEEGRHEHDPDDVDLSGALGFRVYF